MNRVHYIIFLFFFLTLSLDSFAMERVPGFNDQGHNQVVLASNGKKLKNQKKKTRQKSLGQKRIKKNKQKKSPSAPTSPRNSDANVGSRGCISEPSTPLRQKNDESDSDDSNEFQFGPQYRAPILPNTPTEPAASPAANADNSDEDDADEDEDEDSILIDGVKTSGKKLADASVTLMPNSFDNNGVSVNERNESDDDEQDSTGDSFAINDGDHTPVTLSELQDSSTNKDLSRMSLQSSREIQNTKSANDNSPVIANKVPDANLGDSINLSLASDNKATDSFENDDDGESDYDDNNIQINPETPNTTSNSAALTSVRPEDDKNAEQDNDKAHADENSGEDTSEDEGVDIYGVMSNVDGMVHASNDPAKEIEPSFDNDLDTNSQPQEAVNNDSTENLSPKLPKLNPRTLALVTKSLVQPQDDEDGDEDQHDKEDNQGTENNNFKAVGSDTSNNDKDGNPNEDVRNEKNDDEPVKAGSSNQDDEDDTSSEEESDDLDQLPSANANTPQNSSSIQPTSQANPPTGPSTIITLNPAPRASDDSEIRPKRKGRNKLKAAILAITGVTCIGACVYKWLTDKPKFRSQKSENN